MTYTDSSVQLEQLFRRTPEENLDPTNLSDISTTRTRTYFKPELEGNSTRRRTNAANP